VVTHEAKPAWHDQYEALYRGELSIDDFEHLLLQAQSASRPRALMQVVIAETTVKHAANDAH
jgi:hypothetical protein